MNRIVTIAIDNGHGINTPGKRTPIFTDGTRSPLTGKNFMHEWEYNRATAIILEEELKRCGFKTINVSPTEADTPLSTRLQRAKSARADLILSIHANAHLGVWGTANGTEQLVCGTESRRIGQIVQNQIVKDLGLRSRGLKDGCWLGLVGKITQNGQRVPNPNGIPLVLVETAFMDNLTEAKLLLSDDFREKSAISIAKALCTAYGIKYVPKVDIRKEVIEAMGKYFKDVPDNRWSAKFINGLRERGIISGRSDGIFDPTSTITREEVATIVYKAIENVEKKMGVK